MTRWVIPRTHAGLSKWSVWGASTAFAVVAVTMALVLAGRSTVYGEDSQIYTDSFVVNETPVELANGYPVPYVSDCDPGESPPSCGSPRPLPRPPPSPRPATSPISSPGPEIAPATSLGSRLTAAAV